MLHSVRAAPVASNLRAASLTVSVCFSFRSAPCRLLAPLGRPHFLFTIFQSCAERPKSTYVNLSAKTATKANPPAHLIICQKITNAMKLITFDRKEVEEMNVSHFLGLYGLHRLPQGPELRIYFDTFAFL